MYPLSYDGFATLPCQLALLSLCPSAGASICLPSQWSLGLHCGVSYSELTPGQDDALFPSLTVHEAVSYSARLRLFGRQPEELAKLVDQTLRELRLSHIAGSRIGTPAVGGGGRGVSGGERRRVSIAMEMVIQPSIIMLDEPTSGLDSFAAGSLMSRMKEIAAGGRIVIMTLHQPSPNAFLKLDRVLLLANGCKVFSGTPHEVSKIFSRIGHIPHRSLRLARLQIFPVCQALHGPNDAWPQENP